MATKTIADYTAAGSIDAVNDYLLIEPSGNTVYNKINRNTLLGLASAPVGLTDSQTLTNKTLTAPTISSPVLSGTITGTYTIGGSPTFPSTVVTTTGSQTLTNKSISSAVINTPVINNATISSDAYVGFSSPTSGSIYGMSVSGGVLNSAALANAVNTAAVQAGAIGSSQIATNGVAASNLATSAITLGYTQITTSFTLSSSQTTPTQVTGLTATVTIPSGGRRVKITAYCATLTVAAGTGALSIWDGVVNSGTQLNQFNASVVAGNGVMAVAIVTPAAGSKTYNVGVFNSGPNNTTVTASATFPAFILVEAI